MFEKANTNHDGKQTLNCAGHVSHVLAEKGKEVIE